MFTPAEVFNTPAELRPGKVRGIRNKGPLSPLKIRNTALYDK